MNATYIINPVFLGVVVTDGTLAVDQAERQSAARAYEGILATIAAPADGGANGLLLRVY